MHKPELLAPVGSWDALLAALANGADAVYMGGKQFSARAYASNFGEDEIERAAKLAHRSGARVFVTVNTLLRADELEAMAPYLHRLHDVGVDALIVQDLGLVRNLRALMPSMELHASTQMTIHNTEGALLMKELGISRIVLARELTFEQVKRIKDEAEIEIETFIHGALCFAYSGQCLMSSMIGGRSGNRGRCAQPCRLPYDLLNDSQVVNDQCSRHQLSPRDLNQIHYLASWVEVGISALKIEGRMKRPEYVAAVVSTYRRALDAILEGRIKAVTAEDDAILLSAFNRRFTPGFAFAAKGPEMMSTDRPDNRGVEVGELVTRGRDGQRAIVRASVPIHKDDVLELWSPGYERLSVSVPVDVMPGQEVELSTDGMVTGQRGLYRMVSAEQNRKALASFTNWEELVSLRRVRVDLSVCITTGEPVVIEAHTEDGRQAEIRSEVRAEPAQHRPVSEDLVRRAMVKLVDTPFTLGECRVEISGNPSVPISLLNALRRQVVSRLEGRQEGTELGERWERNWPLPLDAHVSPSGSQPLRLVAAVGGHQSIADVLEFRPDIVIFGGESYGEAPSLTDYQRAVDAARSAGVTLVAGLPRITTDEQLAAYRPLLAICEGNGIPVQAANLGQLHVALRNYPVLQLYLHWSLNLFNPWAVEEVLDPRVKVVMPSPELNLGQLEALRPTGAYELAATVGGRLTLMVSEHCLSRNIDPRNCRDCSKEPLRLRDRYGAEFPVHRDQYCRSHILNSQDLCLVEHLHALQRAGITHLVVEGRGYSASDLPKVLGIWRDAVDDYREDPSQWKERGRLYRMELERFSPSGITKGHFFRGVE